MGIAKGGPRAGSKATEGHPIDEGSRDLVATPFQHELGFEVPRIISSTYALYEQLGAGSMGSVFRAIDRLTGREVALKLLGDRADTSFSHDAGTRRLAIAHEFQTLSSLHHPNIICVLDYGFDEAAGPYFTMDLLREARSITQQADHRELTAQLDLLAQLLRALSYLHRRGIVHRDLKPTNVLCVGDALRVTDFGLATTAGDSPDIAGTPQYIAPEVWFGAPPSIASDLYSFGVIAHEVLFGRVPFADSTSLFWLTPNNVTIPGPVGPIVSKLLAKNPTLRYQSAIEVLRDLADATGAALAVETSETRESFLQASAFVGRDDELDKLVAAFGAASEGRGGAWLIAGESGIGKSRLVSELRTRALVQDACVLTGQASVVGGALYEIWVPIIRALCLRVELPDEDASMIHELLPDLEELIGRNVALAPRNARPAAKQTQLRSAIDGLFRRQEQVTVVLLEDLHWASTDSLELLAHLAELARSLPLLLVGTYRDDEGLREPDLLSRTTNLKLQRLDKKDVAALAESMLGERGGTPNVVDYLCRQTEGNVFFLVELVRALAEQAGRLDRINEIELPESLLTGGIERIASRRVDRVPPGERGVLQLAAVLGRELDLDVLQRLEPALPFDLWLVNCANAAVLESRAGNWRFAHDKLRDAILAHIPPDARLALHQRVADALEAVYAGTGQDAKSELLAYHFQQAGDHEKAALFSLRAGDRATRLCSYGEARAHYASAMSALEHLVVTNETRRQKIDVLLQQIYTTLVAESAEQNFGRAAEARRLLDEITKQGGTIREDQARLARLDYFHGRIHFYRGETKEALDYYRRVLPAAMESGDDELIALPSCLIGSALVIEGDAKSAEPLLAQAIGPLERLGEPFEWFRAVGYHGLSLVSLGRYTAGVAELDRVRSRAHEVAQPNLLSAAYLMSGSTFLFSGDWPLVVDYLQRTLEFAGQTGDKLHLSLAHSGIGWAQSHLGKHQEAMEHRRRARQIAEAIGGRLMLNDWYLAADAEIAFHAGDHDLALRLAQEVSEPSASGRLFSRGVAERVWSEALAHRGDVEEAATHMTASISLHEKGGIHVQVAQTQFQWAMQRRRQGDRGAAEKLYQQFRVAMAEFGCVYALEQGERIWNAG